MLTTANPKGRIILVSHELSYTFPFSYAYLAGALRRAGFDVTVFYRSPYVSDLSKLASRILNEKPLMVGFGNLYPELLPIGKVIALLDQRGRKFPVVVGGQMVSPAPEFAVAVTGADIGVIGEGEITIVELAKALRENGDLSSIPGILIRRGSNFLRTGPGSLIESLDELPEIPFHLFPEEKWLHAGKYFTHYPQPQWRYDDRVISIHGGRGCPFKCNFCYHHSRTRYRKIDVMMNEAGEWLKRFNANMLMFNDDLVLATPKRAEKLVERMASLDRRISYRMTCRFDVLTRMDDALLKEMKRTGLRIMALGIESGSQRILDIMDKRITVDQIRHGVERLARFGIFASGNIMFGQISETREDAEASIKLMHELCSIHKHIQISSTVATPFPGTALYDHALANGLIRDHYDFYDRFNAFDKVSVNLSSMSDTELIGMKEAFDRAYQDARQRSTGRATALVESSIRRLADADPAVRRNLFRSNWDRPPRWYGKAYDTLQNALGKAQLSLRNIHRFENA